MAGAYSARQGHCGERSCDRISSPSRYRLYIYLPLLRTIITRVSTSCFRRIKQQLPSSTGKFPGLRSYHSKLHCYFALIARLQEENCSSPDAFSLALHPDSRLFACVLLVFSFKIARKWQRRERPEQPLRNECQRSYILDVVAGDLLQGQQLTESAILLVVQPHPNPSRSDVYANPHHVATSLSDQPATGSTKHRLSARSRSM